MSDPTPTPAAPEEIRDEVRATHLDLDPVALRFLEHAVADPEARKFVDYRGLDVPEWVRAFPFELQPWPMLLGEEKKREVEAAAVGVSTLVKSIPERLFGSDPGRIARFYGYPNELLVALMMERPNGLDGALTRCDLIDDGRSVKCLEVNAAAFLGGWQLRFWEGIYRNHHAVRDVLEKEGREASYRDSLRVLLDHVIRSSVEAGTATGKELNLAVVTPREVVLAPGARRTFDQLFSALLAERGEGLSGGVVFTSYPNGVTGRRGRLFVGETPVAAVLEYTEEPTPEGVYRAFKGGGVCLFNGPVSTLLGDKRNLALLSAAVESGELDAAETELVERHVPWCRPARPGTVRHRGRERDLVELLLAERGEFVVKPGVGAKGSDVFVGAGIDQDTWKRGVDQALSAGGWVAQEFVASRPYLFQAGPSGVAEHDVVWGIFSFGSTYGGGFLRLAHRSQGDRVINAARGATEGLILEL